MRHLTLLAPLLLTMLAPNVAQAEPSFNLALAQPTVAPEPPGMIEVPTTESFERPRNPPHVPMTARKSLFITGGVFLSLGAATLAIGGGLFASGTGSCADLGCGIGHAIDQGIGADIMVAGGAQMLAGLIFFTVGANVHH